MSAIGIFRKPSVICLTAGRRCSGADCVLVLYLRERGLAGEPRPVLMGSGEDIAERRAVVKSNPRLSAKELCEIFDHRQIPVPKRWKDAGIEWWSKAYHQSRFRGRVHDLISKDRTRVNK